MPSQIGFLSLHRELRDIIYQHYVFEADGYHFDYETGKLQASNNRPIDLALMYTCTTVAAEMRNLALGSNLISFSTGHPSRDRLKAGRFQLLLAELHNAKCAALKFSTEPANQPYLTPEVFAKVALRYPQFAPLLHDRVDPVDDGGRQMQHDLRARLPVGNNWGEAGSVHRGFVDYFIEVLSANTGFAEAMAISSIDRQQHFQEADDRSVLYRSPLLLSSPTPWTIPSEDEVTEMGKVLDITKVEHEPLSLLYNRTDFWQRVRWCYSAAAAAIQFFKSVPEKTRLGIQNVLLHEDRESVAYPECHALGLIPFCLENPRLRIERRVNIWRTILPAACFTDLESFVRHDKRGEDGPIFRDISICFASWITEALALSAAGMPANSFSLVFDGDPDLERSSALFEIVKEGVAWQEAHSQWLMQKNMTRGFRERRGNGVYIFEGSLQAISDMVGGKSYIRCNFPIGNLCDVNYFLDICRELPDSRRWYNKWLCYRFPKRFQLSPLLPTWVDLRLEQVIPEEESPEGQASR